MINKGSVSKKSLSTSTASETAPATDSAPLAHVPAIDAAAVEAFIAAIDTFAAQIAQGYEVAQPEDARRMAQPRKEAPTIVPMVADISTRYGVASKSFPVSTMLANQQVASTLVPVIERIGAVNKLIESMVRSSQSGAWEGAMVTYGLLKNEARGNAVLRNALTPVREKMRPTFVTAEGGKTKVKAKAAPKTPGATRGKAAQAGATTAATEAAAASEATASQTQAQAAQPAAGPTNKPQ